MIIINFLFTFYIFRKKSIDEILENFNNLILPETEEYKSSEEFSIFSKKKKYFREEKIESLLKKLDVDLDNLKSINDIKLSKLENYDGKLDNLDLNKNNFYGLFISKIIVNTNKNALGIKDTPKTEEKKEKKSKLIY